VCGPWFLHGWVFILMDGVEKWCQFPYFQQCMQRKNEEKCIASHMVNNGVCILMEHNNVLFKDKVANALEVVDYIKRLS
jgi:hypothetical protein